jgi:hypothetical protein
MDLMKILRDGLALVNNAAEVADELDLPIVGDIAKIAATVTSVAENILARVDEGKVVMSSDDQDEVKGILEALHAKNVELDDYIRNH